MYDVCLVSMPYGAIERPSIALGLLVAGAKQAGLRSKAIYASFWFAEKIGLATYKALSEQGDVADLIGEWTFSPAAFPDFAPDHDAYLGRVLATESYNAQSYPYYLGEKNLAEALWQVRELSSTFVDEAAQRILADKPRIVGCSSVFQQHCASLALLRMIKEIDPTVITMIGGANCEGPMGHVIQGAFPWVDYVVSGEADTLFPQLCRNLLDPSAPDCDESLPYGVLRSTKHASPIAWLARPGESIPRASVRNLDQLPYPDYRDYFDQLDDFRLKDEIIPGLVIETSRGCWWGAKHHCTFCGLNGEVLFFRSKTPRRVEQELRSLRNEFGLSNFEVVDNILDMKFFGSLLPSMAEQNNGYNVFYETKANLDEDHVKTLAAAGVRWIQPGIESLHDEILKLINKGCTALGNITLLKYALENGVRVSWNLLFGVPGERDDWYNEMADWMPAVSHLQPPSSMVRIRYDRFSPYYVNPDQYGIKSMSPNKSYAYVYPISEREMRDLAYFFEDYSDHDRGSLDLPGLERVKQYVLKWRDLFAARERPALVMIEGERGTVIWDSRPVAEQSLIVLEGLSHIVHQACRRPRSLDALLRELENVRPDELQETVCNLVEQKLVLTLGGRLLSLATYAPKPLLTMREYPGGFYRAVAWET